MSTIETVSGKYVNVLNVKPEDICIEDIAHSLSNQCRFTGHSKKFYSVAEHCVHVSYLVPDKDALWGLLHDSMEAYLGDVATPLKTKLPEYMVFENTLEHIILKKFKIPDSSIGTVLHFDKVQLKEEALHLLPSAGLGKEWAWIDAYEELGIEPEGWSPTVAKRKFLARYKELV